MVKYLRPAAFAVFIIFLYACNNSVKETKPDAEEYKTELLATDRAFSDLSEEKGMKAAFLEFIDSNGVLLRPNQLPVAGADAVDYLISLDDTGYTMKWRPSKAMAAASGDLGFTYGMYEIKSSVQDTTLYGTYVSIWKRQQNGKWKFVLDSGNEGVE